MSLLSLADQPASPTPAGPLPDGREPEPTSPQPEADAARSTAVAAPPLQACAIATLHALLNESLALAPETRHALTSHMPMALHALAELGASPSRLRAFHAHHLPRFDGAPPAPAWAPPLADWPARRGDFAAFAGLRTRFALDLAEQGRDAVLQAALPRLWPGLAAAAFHGPIRVAHAVQAGHEGELAAALAYWAARWQPLAPPPVAEPQVWSLQAWSRGLARAAADWRSNAPLISLRMAEATATPIYHAWAGALAPARTFDARWHQLVTLALNIYADSGNFTVLHMVTALRAVQVLAPWLAGEPIDVRVLDHAFTAAWMAARLPASDPPGSRSTPRPVLGWPALRAAALASNDDHVVKLVHACVALALRTGDERLCREAATRAVQSSAD